MQPFMTQMTLWVDSSLNFQSSSSWNAAVFNKLHFVKPSLGGWQPSYRIDRKEEVTHQHQKGIFRAENAIKRTSVLCIRLIC